MRWIGQAATSVRRGADRRKVCKVIDHRAFLTARKLLTGADPLKSLSPPPVPSSGHTVGSRRVADKEAEDNAGKRA
jgi:hypothetical protein